MEEEDFGDISALDEAALGELILKRDEDERTVFHKLCSAGRHEDIRIVIERCHDEAARCATMCDDGGWAPLHSAVSAGHDQVASQLVQDLDAPIDARNSSGCSALHYAASKSRIGLLKMLLERKADVFVRDNGGSTFLHRAVSSGNPKIVALALDKRHCTGSLIEQQDRAGQTALHVAAQLGFFDAVEQLVDAGASKEALDKEEKRPADYARGEIKELLQS